MTFQRYKLTIAYRGARYHGWQHQSLPQTWKGEIPPDGEGLPTIQETIAKVLSRVVGHTVQLVGSSRTDSGVHAKGQVAHFDSTATQIPAEGLRRAVNSKLPDDIVIRHVEAIENDFDAIASTTSKRYQYVVYNADDRPAFYPDLAWHRWQPLNVQAMQQAAAHFVGTHDFSSFARPGHRRENTIRTILATTVSQRRPLVVIGIEGTGFLWNMVRIIAGTLVEVGLERLSPSAIPAMLAARDRRAAGPTAPAHGLYLHWIKYDGAPRPKNAGDDDAEDAVSPEPRIALPPQVPTPAAPTSHPPAAPIHVRDGRPSDLSFLHLLLAASAPDQADAASRRLAGEYLFQNTLVATQDNRPIALAAFSVSDCVATLTWLCVHPRHRRQGLATRMLARISAKLQGVGLTRLQVRATPSSDAVGFFRASGFHPSADSAWLIHDFQTPETSPPHGDSSPAG